MSDIVFDVFLEVSKRYFFSWAERWREILDVVMFYGHYVIIVQQVFFLIIILLLFAHLVNLKHLL